jgi:CHAD domain-containing protein
MIERLNLPRELPALPGMAKRASDGPDRAYRLRVDEYVPDGLRRIARGQLLDARETLDGASKRSLHDAVHEARKHLKRVRTSVRLARDALGETYERENTAFRMAGRSLGATRDAEVRLQTLDALTERFSDELAPGVTADLRARLADERRLATAALREDDGAIQRVVGALSEALVRTPAWTFEPDDFAAVSPGLGRIYRRGRKRMRAARAEPTPERFHDWRKRVKDLRYATQIVRAARPDRLKRVGRLADEVADLLGDDHDLTMLREYVRAHPQCFADEVSRQALVSVIDRRSRRLREKALKRGARLYERSPKRFVAHVERGWRKRAPADQPRVAG